MNIAILSKGPDYADPIGNRVTQSPYILIINRRTFQYGIFGNPLTMGNTMQSHIDFILLLIRKKVSHVLVQRCTEDWRTLLGNHNINVTESVTGSVGDIMHGLQCILPADNFNTPATDTIQIFKRDLPRVLQN